MLILKKNMGRSKILKKGVIGNNIMNKKIKKALEIVVVGWGLKIISVAFPGDTEVESMTQSKYEYDSATQQNLNYDFDSTNYEKKFNCSGNYVVSPSGIISFDL